MKKIYLGWMLLIGCTFTSYAQENEEKVTGQNTFYAELGGPGILFSANYDRRFTNSHLGFGGRVGIGFVSDDLYDNINFTSVPRSIITVPVQLNYLFGKQESVHTFEVGAGVTYLGQKTDVLDFNSDQQTQWFGTASFMYRRQPKNGGFSWRGGLTPLIAKGYIQPFVGFSIGYVF